MAWDHSRYTLAHTSDEASGYIPNKRGEWSENIVTFNLMILTLNEIHVDLPHVVSSDKTHE